MVLLRFVSVKRFVVLTLLTLIPACGAVNDIFKNFYFVTLKTCFPDLKDLLGYRKNYVDAGCGLGLHSLHPARMCVGGLFVRKHTMRFPVWARNDPKLRLKYLCSVMSVFAHKDGSINQLSRLAKVNYQTALKAQEAGRMTYKVATSLAEAASGSGVKAIWLMAPDVIPLNEDGEVIE
jgi:hypothetical protein